MLPPNKRMKEVLSYKNPVLFADYSDPDVIRVGKYFYMVASSFNFVPGVPLLRSENLVEWEVINYIIKKLPFEKFDGRVVAGDGAWAPSIREHNGKFYCLVPFPDDGIFVAEADDIEGEWSTLRPLISDRGIIDPCPVWDGERCFVAVAFARSRKGFNSAIGLYEVSPDLRECISKDYTIIYDGKDNNPVIEGPKFYKRNGYFYILAPAGTVKGGWQVALRSKSVYGPYESKIILMQGDTLVNGPHQGALVQTENGEDWFLHFQDMRVYGRVVHLQPVEWQNDWCVCGKPGYDGIAGTPVCGERYPVQVKTGAKIPFYDNFKGGLSLMWQTPANLCKNWGCVADGLNLNCNLFTGDIQALPTAFTAMVVGAEFNASCRFILQAKTDGDEAGFGIMGRTSAFLSVVYKGGKYFLRTTVSGEDGERTLGEKQICGNEVCVQIKGVNCDIYSLLCSFFADGEEFLHCFKASEGVWVGARFAIFARNKKTHSEGSAKFVEFYRSLPND